VVLVKEKKGCAGASWPHIRRHSSRSRRRRECPGRFDGRVVRKGAADAVERVSARAGWDRRS